MRQRLATRDYHRPQKPKGAPSRGKVTPRKPLGRKPPSPGTAALGLPLWAWMVVSFSVIVLAAVVYYVSRPVAPMDLVPSSENKNGKTAKTIEIPPKEPSRFAFYEMLPSYEVVVPDDVINPPKPKPGTARNNLPPQPVATTTALEQAQAELPVDLRPADVQGLPPAKPVEKPAEKVAVLTTASKPAAVKSVAPPDDAAARLAAEIARETPPQPTAQLARGEQFLIQVAAFRTRTDAEQRVAALTIAGLSARVEQVTIENKDTWYRVRLGPYGSAAAAAGAQQSLRAQGLNGVVMKVKG